MRILATHVIAGSLAAFAASSPAMNTDADDNVQEREQSARIGPMEDYDVDHDQRISREEAQRDGELNAYFVALDTDRNGFVDEQELQQNRERTESRSGKEDEQKVEQGYEGVDYNTAVQDQARDTDGFDVYDTNGDDRISRQEARADENVSSHFVVWDRNDDGYVDRNEHAEGMAAQGEPEDRAGLDGTNGSDASQAQEDDRSVSTYDRDGDGRVSAEEAAQFDLKETFNMLDTNNDNYLDAQEINYDPDARRGEGGNNFRSIDMNQDGYLARNEAANDRYVEANFDSWDSNDDGVLDDGEVDNDWAEWDRDSFDAVDRNGDGGIDANEAKESRYIDYNFDTWDMDQDGKLSEDEVNAGWMNEDEGVFDDEGW